MASELIINASLPETRIALMENGEIQELLIERASGKGIVGNIYKGRVTRVLPGMQAAFVDIGLEKAAFLYVDDVYVHSEIWEEEEGSHSANELAEVHAAENAPDSAGGAEHQPGHSPGHSKDASTSTPTIIVSPGIIKPLEPVSGQNEQHSEEPHPSSAQAAEYSVPAESEDHSELDDQELDIRNDEDRNDLDHDPDHDPNHDEDEDEEDDEGGPVDMGPPPSEGDDQGGDSQEGGGSDDSSGIPEGTVAPESQGDPQSESSSRESSENRGASPAEDAGGPQSDPTRRRHRRGRRGGRFRRRGPAGEGPNAGQAEQPVQPVQQRYPENYREQMADSGKSDSDRSGLAEELQQKKEASVTDVALAGRPENAPSSSAEREQKTDHRADFRSHRSRDRRIRTKAVVRPVRAQVNIQDLLKEGQEILVQVAKDPIATKGARLTCHISLPGRHLVCMPTIDHVGVSRRIEREEERRRLREYVERNRPKNLGFIVRTASGKQQSEKRIKQDIEYLTRLWNEIKEKASSVTAPALVYEDLNSVLRAIRDWVTEEIDKVIVDSRYHFNEIQRFVSHFMPPLKQKVELYHGDIPIFDAYGISTELSRALERKVWLKSGGYIVVDQAEALVAIDVNTGRYVGKKNLEDTILKTNLEAVQEIAYQLRLRNCGGIIILDLIDMEKDENKQRVYRALEDALARDRARPTIMKISDLGLVEMTRKRTRDTIIRTLCESCTHCEGKGFIKSKQTVAYEVMREIEREGIERDVSKILVQAHPDVIDILAIDERETLDQLERRYRKLIYLQAVSDFHPEQFEVSADKRERADRSRDHHTSERSHDRHADQGHDRNRNRHRQHQQAGHYQVSDGVISASSTPIGESPQEAPVISEGGSLIPASLKLERLVAMSSNSNSASASESPAETIEDSASGTESHSESANSHNSTDSEDAESQNSIVSGVHVPSPIIVRSPVINPESPREGTSHDGSYDEEDRLAFLRAQAAQDAALARLGTGGNAGPALRSPQGDGPRNDRGGAPGRRGPRGRRGGKFRRTNERTPNSTRPARGPKPFGFGSHQPAKWVEPAKEVEASAPETTKSSGAGEDPVKGGSSGGAIGGDSSQPQF